MDETTLSPDNEITALEFGNYGVSLRVIQSVDGFHYNFFIPVDNISYCNITGFSPEYSQEQQEEFFNIVKTFTIVESEASKTSKPPPAPMELPKDEIITTAYDEYFSQSIDFMNDYNTSGYVFIFYEDNRNVMYRNDKGEIQNSFPGAVEGCLYIEIFNENNPDDVFFEYFPLLEEQVTAFEQVGERVLCAVDNIIYSINYRDGGDKQVVLTADSTITNLKANDTLVFYVANEVIYRFFVPDNFTDILCGAPGILPGFPVPLTNHQLYWAIFDPDNTVDDNRSYYIYTEQDGVADKISFTELDKLYNEWGQRISWIGFIKKVYPNAVVSDILPLQSGMIIMNDGEFGIITMNSGNLLTVIIEFYNTVTKQIGAVGKGDYVDERNWNWVGTYDRGKDLVISILYNSTTNPGTFDIEINY